MHIEGTCAFHVIIHHHQASKDLWLENLTTVGERITNFHVQISGGGTQTPMAYSSFSYNDYCVLQKLWHIGKKERKIDDHNIMRIKSDMPNYTCN